MLRSEVEGSDLVLQLGTSILYCSVCLFVCLFVCLLIFVKNDKRTCSNLAQNVNLFRA